MRTCILHNNANAEFIIKATDGMLEISAEGLEYGDKYHTMHELYQHRTALNIALFNTLNILSDYHNFRVYKSEHHHPDSDKMFEGYFIVWCIDLHDGSWTSYHYALREYWDKFNIPVDVFSPPFPNKHIRAIDFFSEMFAHPK